MSSCFVKSVEKLFMTRNKSSAAHTTSMAYVTVATPATDALDFLVPGTYLESVPLVRFDPPG
jgi:hypothetical protein